MTPRALTADFRDWSGLRALILDAFAGMDGRIDPPSSAHRLTEEDLRRQAREGWIYIAGNLEGCAVYSRQPDAIYIGKLAVRESARGQGLGRQFVGIAETLARGEGVPRLRLQCRVELTENHRAFRNWGFVQTGTTSHPGFDRPTSLTFEKPVPLDRPPIRT